MDDTKYVLIQDTREKKQAARGASKRVGKSRKCTLPYELMSKEERKRYMAPSEVTTFVLRPMTLKEFRDVPADKKIELLKWYGEKYGWNAAGVAAGLDANYTTGQKLLADFMLNGMFKAKMKVCTKEQKDLFMKNRAELAKTRSVAPEQSEADERFTTRNSDEKPTERRLTLPEPLFEVTMNKNEFGAILERRLEGIAHSLDRGEVYAVKLSIVQLGHQEDSSCDVVQP